MENRTSLNGPETRSWGPLWGLPYWLHLEAIGGDRKVPSARVDQTSAGPKIPLPCGSGTMKNEFCDLENLPTQNFLGYAKNTKTNQTKTWVCA